MIRALRLCLVFALLAVPAFAQTAATRATLYTEIDTLFADTGSDPITPAQLRTSLKNITASSYNELTDAALATTYQPLDSTLTALAAQTEAQAAVEGVVAAAKQNYVYIGNSLTDPTTTGGGDAWPTVLATLSNGLTATHYNYAVSGSDIDDMGTVYTASAYAKRPTGSIVASTLFYFPGANDLFADSGLANGGLGYDADGYMAVWEAFITQAKADGFRVVAFTITPRGRWKDTSGTIAEFTEWALFEARRKEVNRRIRAASDFWDLLVDAEAMFPDPNNKLAYIDHVHLTNDGYETLAKGVNDVLSGKSPAPSVSPLPYLDARETARLEAMFGTRGINCAKIVTNTFVNGPTFGTGDFEFVLSFRPRDLTTAQGLFGGATNSLGVRLETDRRLLFLQTNVGNLSTVDAGVSAEQTNVLFISRESGVIYVRNRDRLIASFANTTDFSAAQSAIGDRINSTTAPFNGFVGPLMIFNRALTDTERHDILRDGFPPAYLAQGIDTFNASAWANDGAAPYETFSGASATGYTAINTSSTGRAEGGDTFAVVVGQVVSFTYTLTLNSGEAPYVRIAKSDLGSNYSALVQLSAGTNTATITATTAGTARLLVSNSSASNYVIADIDAKLEGATLSTGGFSGSATWQDKSGNSADITVGTGNTLTDGPRVGTVTSVAVSGSDGIEIDSGSPVTTSGTIALGVNASTLKTHLSLNNVENTALSTGNAATATALATPRAIYGNNFDGSAALTQVIASTYGGTGNGFAKFSGPTTSEKTFTLPDATATLLYAGGDAGTPSALVGTNISGTAASLTAGAATTLATARTIGNVSFNGSANIVPETITIVDSTDATSFPLIVDSATGSLQPKTDAGLSYDASTGTLTANLLATGAIGIGTTPAVANPINIAANTSGTTPTGVWVQQAIQSSATGYYYGFISYPSVANSAFTLPSLVHFSAFPSSLGASATVTVQTGFEATSSIVGATNNYGFRGRIASGSGQYNLYMDGTALNYLAGVLQLNSTIELGHATDTTIARVSAGLISVEGVNVSTETYAQTAAKATKLGSHASPDTTAGSITWATSAVYEVWTNTTTTYALPAASGYEGKAVIFYVTGTNAITIDPNSSEVIVRDGTAQTGGVTMTLTGAAGNYVCLVCDGARWITLGYKGTLAAGS